MPRPDEASVNGCEPDSFDNLIREQETLREAI